MPEIKIWLLFSETKKQTKNIQIVVSFLQYCIDFEA